MIKKASLFFFKDGEDEVRIFYEKPRKRFLMAIGWDVFCRIGFHLMFKDCGGRWEVQDG